MSFNRIEIIFLPPFDKIKYQLFPKIILNIRENPIVCDCYIYELLNYINDVKIKEKLKIKINKLKCNGPKEYNGEYLSKININEFVCDSTNYDGRMSVMRSLNIPYECLVRKNLKKHIIIIDCDNRKIIQLPNKLCDNCLDYNIELNLRNNLLTKIPNINLFYKNVTKLFLSGNKIENFDTKILDTNIEVSENESENERESEIFLN